MSRELTADEIRSVNLLKDALNAVAKHCNELKTTNIVVDYAVGPDTYGKVALLRLNVYSPVDIKKLGS